MRLTPGAPHTQRLVRPGEGGSSLHSGPNRQDVGMRAFTLKMKMCSCHQQSLLLNVTAAERTEERNSCLEVLNLLQLAASLRNIPS